MESYLDTGDRANFANGYDTTRLFPDVSTRAPDETPALWAARGRAPLVVKGPKFDRVCRSVNSIATVMPRIPGRGHAQQR